MAKRDLGLERYNKLLAAIEVWESKERRATNKLRALREVKASYERRRPDLPRTALMQQLEQSTLGHAATVGKTFNVTSTAIVARNRKKSR